MITIDDLMKLADKIEAKAKQEQDTGVKLGLKQSVLDILKFINEQQLKTLS